MKDKSILLNNGVDISTTLDVIPESEYDKKITNFLGTISSKVNNLNSSLSNLNNYLDTLNDLYIESKELGFMNLMNLLTNSSSFCTLGDINGVNLNHSRIISEINKMISISKQYLNDSSNMDVMDRALSNTNIEITNNIVNVEIDSNKDGIILVVDDSNLVANFVKKIFNVKYNVVIANDGSEAISIVDDEKIRKQIKACLLDLNMPKVNGFEVLEYFKEKGYFVRLPVAIISGIENSEVIDKANTYPIVDVLPKPFNERDVERVVEKCLMTYF